MIKSGPIAFFSSFKLTTSSGKNLESISHAHKVSILYKLISNAKDSNDLSLGFDHSRNRRRDKLTANKSVKGKYYLKFLLKDVFGFAECQEKATYGLGCKLTLTRNKNGAVIDKLVVLLMLEVELITFIGMYPIIRLSFNNKVFYLHKF